MSAPRTLKDLEQFHEADLFGMSTDALSHALSGAGWDDESVAQLLGCDLRTATALRRGCFHTLTAPDGAFTALPEVMLPARALRLRIAFARLITSTQTTKREAPKPEPESVAEGQPDLAMAAWLAQSIKGNAGYSASTIPDQRRRVQDLQTIGCSAATVARAVGTSPQQVVRWLMADKADLPWNSGDDAFTKWLQVTRFLATGPTYEMSERERNKRPANWQEPVAARVF